jgi:hypothetical protein
MIDESVELVAANPPWARESAKRTSNALAAFILNANKGGNK